MVVDSVELFGERIVVVVTPSMATPANGNDTLGPVFTPGWGVKQKTENENIAPPQLSNL